MQRRPYLSLRPFIPHPQPPPPAKTADLPPDSDPAVSPPDSDLTTSPSSARPRDGRARARDHRGQDAMDGAINVSK
ncbi:MAG: hypothetical protein ACK559_05385, partial [bacterium]